MLYEVITRAENRPQSAGLWLGGHRGRGPLRPDLPLIEVA